VIWSLAEHDTAPLEKQRTLRTFRSTLLADAVGGGIAAASTPAAAGLVRELHH
jgi:hypothetical protein